MTDDQPPLPGLKPLSAFLPKVKKPSRIKSRLIEASAAIAADDPDEIFFQHTVFCQTAMPYRDPGNEQREWERTQGRASLLIEAGRARHPETGEWVKLGLPFGPKPRLILAYLNTIALRTGSPEIEVEDSLTAFVERLKLANHGRNIRTVKDQLARLSSATVRLGVMAEDHTINVNANIVSAFDLWFSKDDKQRVLWSLRARSTLPGPKTSQAGGGVYAPPLLLAPDAARCAPNSSRVARTFPTSAQGNHLGSVQVERLCPMTPKPIIRVVG
jgi:Plasmid encoded RepA protein